MTSICTSTQLCCCRTVRRVSQRHIRTLTVGFAAGATPGCRRGSECKPAMPPGQLVRLMLRRCRLRQKSTSCAASSFRCLRSLVLV